MKNQSNIRWSHPFILGLLLLLVLLSTPCLAQKNTTLSRPRMYTYFQRIPEERRFTDMTDKDDDELLQFWKDTWSAAGWEPVVLSEDDAKKHPRYQHYEDQIQSLRMDDFGQISMRKYVAMSASLQSSSSGGWMCDYDVFPLRDFRTRTIPNNFALCDILAAPLASGNAESWEKILQSMLEEGKSTVNANATQKCNMWSDRLSSYELIRQGIIRRPERLVMPGNLLLIPEDGWSKEYCSKRQFRKKYLVVHMDPQNLLVGFAHKDLLLPRHRATVARRVIPNFELHCGVKIVDDDSTLTTKK